MWATGSFQEVGWGAVTALRGGRRLAVGGVGALSVSGCLWDISWSGCELRVSVCAGGGVGVYGYLLVTFRNVCI